MQASSLAAHGPVRRGRESVGEEGGTKREDVNGPSGKEMDRRMGHHRQLSLPRPRVRLFALSLITSTCSPITVPPHSPFSVHPSSLRVAFQGRHVSVRPLREGRGLGQRHRRRPYDLRATHRPQGSVLSPYRPGHLPRVCLLYGPRALQRPQRSWWWWPDRCYRQCEREYGSLRDLCLYGFLCWVRRVNAPTKISPL